MNTADEIRNWVRGHLAGVLNVAPESIAFDRKLSDYGLDSVDAILMAGELEDHFGLEIDPATFIQYATFESMMTSLAAVLDARRQSAPGA